MEGKREGDGLEGVKEEGIHIKAWNRLLWVGVLVCERGWSCRMPRDSLLPFFSSSSSPSYVSYSLVRWFWGWASSLSFSLSLLFCYLSVSFLFSFLFLLRRNMSCVPRFVAAHVHKFAFSLCHQVQWHRRWPKASSSLVCVVRGLFVTVSSVFKVKNDAIHLNIAYSHTYPRHTLRLSGIWHELRLFSYLYMFFFLKWLNLSHICIYSCISVDFALFSWWKTTAKPFIIPLLFLVFVSAVFPLSIIIHPCLEAFGINSNCPNTYTYMSAGFCLPVLGDQSELLIRCLHSCHLKRVSEGVTDGVSFGLICNVAQHYLFTQMY